MNIKTSKETRSTEDMYHAAFMAIHFLGYWIEGKETGKATFVFDVGNEGRYLDELSRAY